jgi:hypothetical protein
MEYYYFDVFLTETYKSLGQYEPITNPYIVGDLKQVTINQTTVPPPIFQPQPPFVNLSGICKSRLEEVRSYNLNIPYKVGVNGVTVVNTDFIEYTIDNISYKTFLADNLTIFTAKKNQQILDYQPLIWNADSVFIDIKKTLNAMVIERGNISVYDFLNKINNCDELDDLLEIF